MTDGWPLPGETLQVAYRNECDLRTGQHLKAVVRHIEEQVLKVERIVRVSELELAAREDWADATFLANTGVSD